MQPMLRAKPRPVRRQASDSRAWTVAQKLRARRGWLLDGAYVQRSWSVKLGKGAFETSADVSFFFDAPGLVIALTPAAHVADALGALRASLGDRYRVSPLGDSIFTKLRSDKPKELLAEIAHVEHVFGERVARRLGPSPRSQDQRRWYVVEALRASSWRLGSLSFSRNVGDKQRGMSASIAVLIDSASGRPGLSANVGGWVPKTNKRWTQFCDDAALGLTTAGFRINVREPSFFTAGRWIDGLSAARALKQAEMFDELLDRGARALAR